MKAQSHSIGCQFGYKTLRYGVGDPVCKLHIKGAKGIVYKVDTLAWPQAASSGIRNPGPDIYSVAAKRGVRGNRHTVNHRPDRILELTRSK
ncbi:hypothetical protein ES703_58703 [subsurface metagenome]